MKRLLLSLTFGFITLACAVNVAVADVSMGTSTNATSDVDKALSKVLATERVAMRSVTPNDLDRLSRVPARAPKNEIYSNSYLSGLPAAKGGDQWYCLAEALYFEARGETVRGQFAVAEVIMNRVESSRFPGTVCGVVNQGTGERFRCQFTYTCDGRAETINERAAWERAGKIARLILDGAPRGLTGGATHYHTLAVRPKWARVFPVTATIGEHRFYRMGGTQAANS